MDRLVFGITLCKKLLQKHTCSLQLLIIPSDEMQKTVRQRNS